MLRTRIASAIVLIPITVACIYWGAGFFLALVAALLTLAEIEFCQLMRRGGFRPTLAFGLALLWVFLLDAQLSPPGLQQAGTALIVLGSLVWQMLHRESAPVADWALTLTGGLYLGICGAHLIELRNIGGSGGLWWTMTAVLSIMTADSGAYFVGRQWGRHKWAPTLSPGKTWEGYLGGIATGALVTGLWATLARGHAGPGVKINGAHGLALGLAIAAIAPLGDLGISMIKRQVGAKDSSNVIPGHGGALDRTDSVLWAAVIAYYYVRWLTG